MKIFEFKDFDEYKNLNTEVNIRKLGAPLMAFKYDPIINYIKKNISSPTLGICHGARNNNEPAYFKKNVGCEVIGTDISHTASRFENMIQWDFHNVKEEWLDSVDFIYSNSTDHSHSPKYCFYQWIRCLKPNGLIFVEWDVDKGVAGYNAADCFGATLEEYKSLFTEMGCLKDLLHISDKRHFFVLHKVPVQYEDIKGLNQFLDV